jgi:DNA-binding SARP family transcriptional activator
MRVRVLGPLVVEDVEPSALGGRKARTLLAALGVARGQVVEADTLIQLVWPESPPAKPSDQISVLVSRLRRTLGAHRIVRSATGYELVADWIDVVELDERVAEAASRLHAGNAATARAAAQAALELVRGRLAVDEDAPWFDDQRALVERVIARARGVLADAALAGGDPAAAAAAAEATLDHDPYDEHALRTLMRAHVAFGRPASALAAYARVRARLAEGLGVDPSIETEQLHTTILRGEAMPTAPAQPLPRVVGRERDLMALEAALARASGGQPSAVVVEGEPGIGKSALIDAFRARVSDDALVIIGRCDELGRDLPLQPLLDGVERHLRAAGISTRDMIDADTTALGPLLGLSQEGTTSSGVTTTWDADDGQAALFRSLLGVIERLAAGRPIVIVLEDVHLAGVGTVEWVQYALRCAARLLVVATRRAQPGPTIAEAETLVVGPLGLDAAAALVGEERAGELHQRSGGNPLFLVELAAARGGALPASIRALARARADALGDAAAASLLTAAVLGPDIDVDLLAAVVHVEVGQLLDHLDAAVDIRLVAESGGVMRFTHELIREALETSATAARRAYLHREAARVLAARRHIDPLAIAWHARQGGDTELAAGALIHAARAASARFDLDEAARLLGDAVEMYESAEAHRELARVRMARWELTSARASVERAIELGGGVGALELAGWVAYYQRAFGDAWRFVEEALARADDPALRASCLALAGRVRHTRGELSAAEAYLEEAVAIAPPEVRSVASIWLGGLRMHQGRPAEAQDLAARGLLDTEGITHPFAPLHGLYVRAYGLGAEGRVAEALGVLHRLVEAVDRAGEQAKRFGPIERNVRGWLLRNLGRVDEADEFNAAAADLPPEIVAFNEPRYVGHLDLVEGRLIAGDLASAGDRLDAIADIEQWDGTMAWHQRERYWLLRARLAVESADTDRAYELAVGVERDAAERGCRRYELFARAVIARAGGPADRNAIEALLAELERIAAPEAWWYTAQLADALDVERWWADAVRRVDRLASAAGPDGEGLRAHAAARFPRLA